MELSAVTHLLFWCKGGCLRNMNVNSGSDKAARRAEFAALAHQWETDMLKMARRLTQGDDDRAQDLVQDTLIRAYQAYSEGRFDEGGNAKAWLFRILTNLFINEYRRRQKWDAGVDVETLTASGDTGPSQTHAAAADVPGVTLLKQTLDEELEQALNSLSEGLRDCVVMVDMQEMDYAEAAKALDIPIGTVRSRLSRARMQLHDLLYEYGRRKRLITE
jgi:RNA polymerase sigma-70 factor, ECF subfamily